ncbi:MAG: hypothetical protein MUO85_10295 [candidate division Zixibacteria bacterium]|nr:hypothetical protein [candidate division Zixibacteria bacterium]
MRRSEIVFLVVAMILAAVIGGLIGEIVSSFLPEGAVKTLFEKSIQIGFKTIEVQFYAISLAFGIMFRINFVSILLIILVMIYFRWWYF